MADESEVLGMPADSAAHSIVCIISYNLYYTIKDS